MTATLIQPTHVLDLRTIPPRERHPLIFGRFDGLTQPVLPKYCKMFDDRSYGQFEWTVLEAGPSVWRIQIARTANAATAQPAARGDSCCSGGACCG